MHTIVAGKSPKAARATIAPIVADANADTEITPFMLLHFVLVAMSVGRIRARAVLVAMLTVPAVMGQSVQGRLKRQVVAKEQSHVAGRPERWYGRWSHCRLHCRWLKRECTSNDALTLAALAAVIALVML